MDLKHMRAFVAVAERLNFRIAAEHLHVTQPALSVQIRDLEQFVGHTLLNRGKGQGVSLTQNGRVFLEGALATLRSADVAIKSVRQKSTADAGTLSIGFSDDFLNSPLLGVLEKFHTDYPHVLVNYNVDISYNLVRSLQAKQLDAVLLCFPIPIPGAEFEIVELPPMPMVIAVSRKHPLAQRRSIWLRDLRREDFIMFPSHVVSGFSAHVARLFAHAGFSPNVVSYANSSDLIAELVARRVGIAILTRNSLSKVPDDLVLLELRDGHPAIDTGLLRPVVGATRFADELCRRLVHAFNGDSGATHSRPAGSHAKSDAQPAHKRKTRSRGT